MFFSGPPHLILRAWRAGRVKLVLSSATLDEYHRVGQELAEQFTGVDLAPIEALLATLASRTRIVVSGDKELLRVTGWRGIEVLRPRVFVDSYLSP